MTILFLQALFLGIVQGITEFLPISSSGHLVVIESIFGLSVENLGAFDIFLHFGTLLAIFLFFWKEVRQMAIEIVFFWQGKFFDKLIVKLIIATIPAAVFGILFKDWIEANLRRADMAGIFMLLTGVLFLLAERFPREKKKEKTGFKNILAMSLTQIAGLFPGISRSGSVIAGGMFAGLKRKEAARFSFLMALPAIGGASFLQALDFWNQKTIEYNFLDYWWFYGAGFSAALLSSFFAIKYVLKFFSRHRLSSFSIYLFLAGILIILFL